MTNPTNPSTEDSVCPTCSGTGDLILSGQSFPCTRCNGTGVLQEQMEKALDALESLSGGTGRIPTVPEQVLEAADKYKGKWVESVSPTKKAQDELFYGSVKEAVEARTDVNEKAQELERLAKKFDELGLPAGATLACKRAAEESQESEEYPCSACDGSGKTYHKRDDDYYNCKKCGGTGKIVVRDTISNPIGTVAGVPLRDGETLSIDMGSGATSVSNPKVEPSAEDFIMWGWGKRCKTKDYEDFPELKDATQGRCAGCEMWEHYDEYLAELATPPDAKPSYPLNIKAPGLRVEVKEDAKPISATPEHGLGHPDANSAHPTKDDLEFIDELTGKDDAKPLQVSEDVKENADTVTSDAILKPSKSRELEHPDTKPNLEQVAEHLENGGTVRVDLEHPDGLRHELLTLWYAATEGYERTGAISQTEEAIKELNKASQSKYAIKAYNRAFYKLSVILQASKGLSRGGIIKEFKDVIDQAITEERGKL